MTVEDLRKYKENLYSALSRDLSDFEKNFILISSAILAFTITFLKDIVNIDETIFISFLLFSWIIITISIGLMMLTFILSAKASDELFKQVDDFIIENSLFKNDQELENTQVLAIKKVVNDSYYKSKKNLRLLRLSAVACFLIGIIFLSVFVYINLSKQSKQKKETKTQSTGTISYPTNKISLKISCTNEKCKQADSTIEATTKTPTATKATTKTPSATKATTKTRAKT